MNKIIFIHGAWHDASCWESLRNTLSLAPSQTVSVQLSALGTDKTPSDQVDLSVHVQDVEKALAGFDEPAYLIAHSYSGMVASQVAENHPDKVAGILYIAAFLPVDSETALSLAQKDESSLAGRYLQVDPVMAVACVPEDVTRQAFYGCATQDIDTQVEVNRLLSTLRPHPLRTFTQAVRLSEAFAGIPKFYVCCLHDQAVGYAHQQFMLSRYPYIKSVALNTDHSPYVTMADALSVIVKGFCVPLQDYSRNKKCKCSQV